MTARLVLDDSDPNQTMAPELSFNIREPAGNKDVLTLKVEIKLLKLTCKVGCQTFKVNFKSWNPTLQVNFEC